MEGGPNLTPYVIYLELYLYLSIHIYIYDIYIYIWASLIPI